MRDDNRLKLTLLWCPPGRFKMGSPASDSQAEEYEQPQVEATLSRGFWLGKTEVTQGQWEQVMETSPWKGNEELAKAGENYAVTYVSQVDALEFCRKLTEQERLAGRLSENEAYTLPSEAQWEYACRAGTTTKYSFGNNAFKLGDYAWYGDNAFDAGRRYAQEVGRKAANPWGFHDLHGNVWEWCLDGYDGKVPGGRDPLVTTGKDRVMRGGSWGDTAGLARSALRRWFTPMQRDCNIGFRVALISSEK